MESSAVCMCSLCRRCDGPLPLLGLPAHVFGPLLAAVWGTAADPAAALRTALWPKPTPGAAVAAQQAAELARERRWQPWCHATTLLSTAGHQLASAARRPGGGAEPATSSARRRLAGFGRHPRVASHRGWPGGRRVWSGRVQPKQRRQLVSGQHVQQAGRGGSWESWYPSGEPESGLASLGQAVRGGWSLQQDGSTVPESQCSAGTQVRDIIAITRTGPCYNYTLFFFLVEKKYSLSLRMLTLNEGVIHVKICDRQRC